MSHAATHWAWSTGGLSSGAKIVLLALADCHNGQTGECFPSQKRMAEVCGMGRSTVNRHLLALENAGLIVREQRRHPTNKTREQTHYHLQIGTKAHVPNRDTDAKAMSQFEHEPCPDLSKTHVPNRDSNLEELTGKINREVRASARDPVSILSEIVPRQVAEDYVEHRKVKRAKITTKAAELIVAKFYRHPNVDPVECFNQSIENGWTGVFPEKMNGSTNGQDAATQRSNARLQSWLAGARDF